MPRPLLIGKSRRITISELSNLCSDHRGENDIILQLVKTTEEETSADDGERGATLLKKLQVCLTSERFAKSKNGGVNDEVNSGCSSKLALLIGSLTLVAIYIAQERAISSSEQSQEVAGKLLDLVNAILGDDTAALTDENLSAILSNSATFFELLSDESALGIIPKCPSDSFIQNTLITKAIDNTRIMLSLAALHSLTVSSRSDVCVAALSAERLRMNAKLAFDSTWYDTLRPHRSCISIAQIMRVLLEGSKYANAENETQSVISPAAGAVASVPNTHGPSHDAIASAYKTLELEMNSCDDPRFATKFSAPEGVVGLSVSNLLNATLQILDSSLLRLAKTVTNTAEIKSVTSSTDLAQAFEAAVFQLRSSLEDELARGLEFLHSELLQAKTDFEKKEAEKAERAAAYAAKQQENQGATDGPDEFEGMSEEKKQKILRKRAEKEAKAAAKKKKAGTGPGESKDEAAAIAALASQLFGSGVTQLLKVIMPTENIAEKPIPPKLSGDLLSKIEEVVENMLRGGIQRIPKIPKGTRDYLPEQMMIRDEAFQIIRRAFKRHGAVEIDTPVFELKETLTGKYGEDSKLIYDLADQGGELLSLRYDLTVPFARYLALNTVGNIKRFHIGKVYRRDQPQLSRGRYREFYQCDFDIAGLYGRMVPDAECLCVAIEILSSLPIGDFMIKINHRKLLDAILDLCGVPAEKFRTICSAVDKLDKEVWEDVKSEMVEKGMEPSVADKIGTFVLQKGAPRTMYQQLIESGKFSGHKGASDAIEDMRILFDYLDAMGKLDSISFDMSLARGLDYYTGVIYEAVSISGETQVGSIGGGGRYDNLVGMFQGAGKTVPCVGVSVGIERVFTLMESRLRAQSGGTIKQTTVSVLVASVGEGMIAERMKIAKLLWEGNISAEYSQQENPKLAKEITNALERGVPFMVVIGEEELKESKCKVKDLGAREEVLVPMSELVSTLLERGVVPVGCEFASQMKTSLKK